jgi:hypothetical protein
MPRPAFDSSAAPAPTPRKAWKAPVVTRLPRLTDLTLATGSGIPGDANIGTGSTVIS